MSHDHELPAEPNATAVTDPPALRPEPAFLARARRILGGDVRPDDYLATTPEIEAGVALDLAFAADHVRKAYEAGRIPAVFEQDPCAAVRQRNERLLSAYYGGQNIACIETDKGVVVLTVGLEQGAALLDAFPYEQRKNVMFDAPDLPDTIRL